MYVSTTITPNYTKTPVVFSTHCFNVQYADMVSASQLENLCQSTSSMQSRRLSANVPIL